MDLKVKLGREVEMHKKNKNELREQINESRSQLADLKKKSQLGTIQTSQGGTTDKNGAAQEMEVNIEELLNDLRRDICRVHINTHSPEMDLQAKQTIDILTELEVELEENMKQLHYMEIIDEVAIRKEEKARKDLYKKDLRDQFTKKEQELIDKKNKDLQMRMERKYIKVGRTTMPRSQKKRVKREVRVVKIDQETLDRQRYLGEEASGDQNTQ